MIDWLLSELHPQSPLFWLVVSFVVTISLAIVHWRTRSPWVSWLWIVQWMLIPYFGLVMGGLSPRLMGLSGLDWPATLGFGSALLFVVLVLLVSVRAAVELSDGPLPHTGRSTPTDAPAGDRDPASSLPVWRLVVFAVVVGGAEEFHWVFLRGALWELLLSSPVPRELPAYWATWIAAIAVILESALRRLSFEQWLVQVAVLTSTSILFLYTRNFWICWILHSVAFLILTTNSRTLRLLPGQTSPARR